MDFPCPLQPARLVRRYKRFLAEAVDAQGDTFTLHCPNTGRMTGCAEPGWTIWYSQSDNPSRKYPCTWELSQTPAGQFIGVNTARANGLVAEALAAGVIPELAGYPQLEREVRLGGEPSRLDFKLAGPGRPVCYLEVKSVTWRVGEGTGIFPDAPSERGRKHLRSLMALRAAGHRAALLFCVQHEGIERVAPAWEIDPDYACLLAEARDAGVELLAWQAALGPERLRLVRPLPVVLQA